MGTKKRSVAKPKAKKAAKKAPPRPAKAAKAPAPKKAKAKSRPNAAPKTRAPITTLSPLLYDMEAPPVSLAYELDAAAFVSDDPKQAYDHFSKVLLAQGGDVAVANGSAAVVRHNVQRGFNMIAPHLSEIPQLVPSVSINRLMELPTLALALVYAEGQIPTATRTDIESSLARVTEPRELTLSYMEIAARLGLVDGQRVKDIRAGSGKLDKARDCVDIAGMFDDYAAALKSKHPFPAGYVESMRTTGAYLVQTLTPAGAVKDKKARPPQADLRDRFFAAVRERYDDLEKAAVQIWGLRDAVDRVPAMLAHEQGKTIPPPPPAPPPPPPPAP